MSDDASERLKRAIRAFTVDAVDHVGRPAPNGPAEAAWRRLTDSLLALPPSPTAQKISALVCEYLDAEVERTQELRIAAEAFFGEDFLGPRDG